MSKEHNPRNKEDFWMYKAPPELLSRLEQVRIERIKKGKDKQMVSFKRLGLAISRHEQLINDLINADLIEERRKK